MQKFKFILAALACSAMFTGCLSQFQELNTNEELLGVVDPCNVFTGATQNFNNSSRGHLTGKYSSAMRVMQYVVSSSGPAAGVYYQASNPNSHPSVTNYAYSDYYGSVGLRLDNLIKTTIPAQENPEQYNDVKAIAQILLSYKQWQMLDTYGAAPITEAFKAQSDGITKPRYDLYEENINGQPMYEVIDAEVKAAVEMLKASNEEQVNLGNNDFFYFGDVAKWIKFGNTLRVKMAQRLELAKPEFYNAVISEVASNAENLIASNAESMVYNHPNDYNNNIDDIQDLTSRYVASAAFVNYLKAYNDPRLPLLVRRNGFGTENNNAQNDEWFRIFAAEYPDWATTYAEYADRYHGMSANPDSSESKWQRSAYMDAVVYKDTAYYRTGELVDTTTMTMTIRMHSQVESRYYVKNGGRNGNNNMPAREIEDTRFEVNQDKIGCYTPILTYPETCLMMAEIALKKGGAVAGKDATAWMQEGIKASMEQYRAWAEKMYVVAQNATQPGYRDQLTDAEIAAYLAQPEFQTATLEKIVSQQWVNLYNQPEEMWATWKRTGYPKFKDYDRLTEKDGGVAYLETIHKDDDVLVIPRRSQLGTPNSLNMENYLLAVDKMINGGYNYGADVQNTEGRIWWDRN